MAHRGQGKSHIEPLARDISFGLSDRELINGTFLLIEIGSGLNCPLPNVELVLPVILAKEFAAQIERGSE